MWVGGWVRRRSPGCHPPPPHPRQCQAVVVGPVGAATSTVALHLTGPTLVPLSALLRNLVHLVCCTCWPFGWTGARVIFTTSQHAGPVYKNCLVVVSGVIGLEPVGGLKVLDTPPPPPPPSFDSCAITVYYITVLLVSLRRCQRVLPDPSALGTLRCMHCSRRRAETSLPRSPPKGCTGRCPLLSLSARSRKACPLPRLHRREWGLWLPAKIPRPSVPRPLRPSRDSVRPGSSIIHRRRLLHRLRNPPVWHPVPCPRASRLLPRRTWGYDRDSRRPRLHRQAQKRRMMTGLKVWQSP